MFTNLNFSIVMELVFATNNPNKIRELQEILGNKIHLISLKEIGCQEEIPEEQATIEGNASQKSFFVYDKYQYDCFADDTGLEIEALNGEPGVYSARYAGEPSDSKANIKKVLEKMKGISNRKARFKTVISLLIAGQENLFEGVVEGEILESPTGEAGFGYDPIFQPQGYELSFAQMDAQLKNSISHRGIAVGKLTDYLLNV